jgi:VanZ family protein
MVQRRKELNRNRHHFPLYAEGRRDGRIEPMTEGVWRSCFHPRWLLLTLLAAGIVLGLTHIPGERMPRALQVHYLDKAEHVVAYGVIAGFFLLSLKRPIRPAVLLIGLVVLAVLGILDETTQPLVNRFASVSDYACDLIGIAIPCAVFLVGGLSRSSVAGR